MSFLLSFHRLGAARGDGLRPELLDLIERRCSLESDPRTVGMDAARGHGPRQSGPNPGNSRLPDFLPGNVIPFAPRSARAAATVETPKSNKA